jgi:hypothetical protein
MNVQHSEVAYLGTDPMQRAVCALKNCPAVGPLASMKVWRIWDSKQESWRYWSFCDHLHMLECVPAAVLPQA